MKQQNQADFLSLTREPTAEPFCCSRNREMNGTLMYARRTRAMNAVLRKPIEVCHGAGKQAIVAGLRHFRQQLEAGMGPELWTDLEVPAYIMLADVCDVLRLTSDEKAVVLGRDGQQRQDVTLGTWVRPRPLSERQIRALLEVQRRGHIANGDLQRFFPGFSAETLRLDLVDLVNRGLLRRHGRCRGTIYVLA